MTASNDLCRPAAAVRADTVFSTAGASPGLAVDAVACPLGGGSFVAGGSVRDGLLPNPPATTVVPVDVLAVVFGQLCERVAHAAMAGVPVEPELRRRWHEVRGRLRAARVADRCDWAVAEGNDPSGIVRPVEAVTP